MVQKGEILLVDDEATVRKGYRALFEGEGYSVRTARDGRDALERFAEKTPDIVLMDVMMPRMNGIAACIEIRKTDPLVPILFFTAAPSDAGLVRALGCGADDYIDKERSPEEVLARVAAVLRRRAAEEAARGKPPNLRLGSVMVDFEKMTANGPGVDVRLSRGEVQLLSLLASARGKPFSYDRLLAALHGEGTDCLEGAVHSVVSRLKAKLGPAGSLIVVERGVGYRLIS